MNRQDRDRGTGMRLTEKTRKLKETEKEGREIEQRKEGKEGGREQ